MLTLILLFRAVVIPRTTLCSFATYFLGLVWMPMCAWARIVRVAMLGC